MKNIINLPKKVYKVVLPANEMQDGEVYAPGMRDGSHLILFANGKHLTAKVNNKVKSAAEHYHHAFDGVGFNRAMADMLGVDFDGDYIEVSAVLDYKNFLKKIGISIGTLGISALGLYALNRSKFGYELKDMAIEKLMRSIVKSNDVFFIMRCTGDSAIYTEQNVKDILNAAAKIADEIGIPKGLPKLTDL